MGLPKWRARTWVYYLTVVALGMGVIGVSALRLATNPTGELTWMLLLGPIVLMARLYVQVPGQVGRICPSGVFTLYSAVVFGPEETVILALVEALIVGWDQTAQAYTRLLFNVSAIPLAACLGALIAQNIGLAAVVDSTSSLVMVQAFAAAVAYFLFNLSFILGIMWSTGGLAAIAQVKPILLWSWAPYAVGGVSAGMLGFVDPNGSPLGILTATAVLYLTWRCLAYYFDALAEKKEALAEKAEALRVNEDLLTQKEGLLQEIRMTHLASLKTLAMAIEAKDPLNHGHGQRVEALVTTILVCMELPKSTQEALSVAALLHDVGKLGVPEYLLYPNRKLDDDDRKKLQSHARIGAEILSNARLDPMVTQVIRHHHERWDGGGYPHRLEGEDIPLGARILHIADYWDKLRHPRVGAGLTLQEAMLSMKVESGRTLDPDLVDLVLLNEGDILRRTEERDVGFFEREGLEAPVSEGVVKALQSHHQETRAIFDLGEKLRSTMQLGEILRVTCAAVMEFIHADSGLVFLPSVDGDNHELVLIAGPTPFDANTFREEDWSRALQVMALGPHGSFTRNTMAEILGVPPETLAFTTYVFPMELATMSRGFLVIWGDEDPLEDDALRVASTLVAQAVPVISNARSYDQVQKESITDALTGLANGRFLRQEGPKLIQKSLDWEESGFVVMLDLNGFKAINDILGHHEGDALLVDISRVIKNGTRKGELAVRNGGDEFVLIWPNVKKAEALRRLDALFIEASSYWPEVWDHAKGTSSGLGHFPDDGIELAALMKLADERMFIDKKAKKMKRYSG